MSTKHLKNISVSQFQSFLELVKCKFIHTKGGHEKWTRSDLLRPIIIQNHIEPIPEFIVKNNLRLLGYSKNDFFDILEFKKEVIKSAGDYCLVERKK